MVQQQITIIDIEMTSFQKQNYWHVHDIAIYSAISPQFNVRIMGAKRYG